MKLSEKALSISGVNDDLKYLREEFAQCSSPSDRDGLLQFDMLIDWVEKNQYNLEHLIKVIRAMEKI